MVIWLVISIVIVIAFVNCVLYFVVFVVVAFAYTHSLL